MTKTSDINPDNISVIAWSFSCADKLLEKCGNYVTTLSGYLPLRSYGLNQVANVSDCYILNFSIRNGFRTYDCPCEYFEILDTFKSSEFYRSLHSLYYNIAPRDRVNTGLYPPPIVINQSLNYDILKAITLIKLYKNLEVVFFGIHPHGAFDLALYFVSRYFGIDCIVSHEHTYTNHSEFFLNSFDYPYHDVWDRSNSILNPKRGSSVSASEEMQLSISSNHSNSDHSRFLDRYGKLAVSPSRLLTRFIDLFTRNLSLTYYKVAINLVLNRRRYLYALFQNLSVSVFGKAPLKSVYRDKSIVRFLEKCSINLRNCRRESCLPGTALIVNLLKKAGNYESVSRYKQYADPNFLSKILLEKKFVILFLHHQPETSTNTDGIKYEDQILFVSTLRSVLPADVILLVKDVRATNAFISYEKHPDMLLNLNNVYQVPSTYNSYALIEASEAVATVTGTAGFEAIAAGKVVIHGGSPIWKHHPNAIYIGDIRSHDHYYHLIDNIDCTQASLESIYTPIDSNLWVGKFNLPSASSPSKLVELFISVMHSYKSSYFV